MAGRVEGKVAFITGAARGQGRSHAVRLAEEGADIIALDLCGQTDSVNYQLGTEEELAETAAMVEELGRRIVARKADVRDPAQVQQVVDEGVATLGHVDIVSASAGIAHVAMVEEMSHDYWKEMIDVNLNGVFNTVKAVVPQMRKQNTGGAIVITSSLGGLNSWPAMSSYCASKHGVIGLMKSLANELGPADIRVNCIAPTTVDTPMSQNPALWASFGVSSKDEFAELYKSQHLLPYGVIEPRDVSNALLWLASDEARFVTGISLPVDCGGMQKAPALH